MNTFTEPDPAERSAFGTAGGTSAHLKEYVRAASSGRKHFPLAVRAPLSDFAAIAEQYPVYRIEVRVG